MRVLLNGLQAGNLSGTGRYTTELARHLAGLSEDAQCAVLWPGHVSEPHGLGGERCVFHPAPTQRFLSRLYYDQWGIRSVRTRIRADLIHYPANIGSLLPMRNTVLTVHDLCFLHDAAWFRPDRAAYYRWTIGRSVRTAERIIADSQATAADLSNLLGVSAKRIDVIPLGVGEEFRPISGESCATVRAWYKLPERFFLYVGTIEPRKNLVRLIEAWERIAGKCSADLVIAGRNGWRYGPIKEAAAASPHAARIHFPGFIAHEDLPTLLSSAETFVWPSLCEGFGLPPLEAMACGTPVVTSNVSSLPEVVGDAAIQVDPADVYALSEAMLKVAEDSAVREDLIARGAARAAEFTWERTARLTLDSYRKAMG